MSSTPRRLRLQASGSIRKQVLGVVLASDVAARDVQAATPPANRIAPPEQSLGALRATAPGQGGQAGVAKAKSLNGLPNGKPALSKFPAMWPRETTARSGDIGGEVGSPPAKPMSSGFAAEHRRLCRSEKHEVFGCLRKWLRSRQSADSERKCGVEH